MVISVAQIQMFVLALTRVLAILVQIPLFASSNVPTQYKAAFGILLTMLIIPWQPLPVTAEGMNTFAFAYSIFQELVIGLLIGFAASITFGTFQTAAKIMELGSGFSAGQIFNPTLGNVGSAFDQFFVMIVMLVFLIMNGHHIFILAIQKSFDYLPLLSTVPDFSVQTLLLYFSYFFAIGVQIALPVFGSILLADLSLGLLAKVAPQIQVFFLGLPLKVGLGVIGLMIALQVIIPVIANLFGEVGERMLGLLGV